MPDFDAFFEGMMRMFQEPVQFYFENVRRESAALDGPLARLTARNRLTLLLAQVRERLRRILRLAHQLGAVFGNGGQPLTQAQHERVADMVADQERYMERFLVELPTLTEAEALHRAGQYATPVLHTAAHIAAGQMPRLPHYPGDLDLACHGFCRCHLRIDKRSDDGDWDVYWIVDPDAEHCVDCVALSQAWSPLEIRGYQVMGEEKAA
jgi:hypothetical protein